MIRMKKTHPEVALITSGNGTIALYTIAGKIIAGEETGYVARLILAEAIAMRLEG